MYKRILFLLVVLGLVASATNAAPLLMEDGEGPMDGSALPYTYTAGGNQTNLATDDYWSDLTYQPGGRWNLAGVAAAQDTVDKVSGTGSLKMTGALGGGTWLSKHMWGGGPAGAGTNVGAYRKGFDYWIKLDGPDSDTIVYSDWTDEGGGSDLYSCKALVGYWSESGVIGDGTLESWNNGSARRQAGIQLYGGCSRDISYPVGFEFTPSLVSFQEWHHVVTGATDSFGRILEFTDDNADELPDTTNPNCQFTTIDGYVVNIRSNTAPPLPMTPAQCIAAPAAMVYVEEADIRTKGNGYADHMWTNGLNALDCYYFRNDFSQAPGYGYDMWIDDAYMLPEPASLVLLGLGGLLLRKRR